MSAGPFIVTHTQATHRAIPTGEPVEAVLYREAFATLEDHGDLELNDVLRMLLRAAGFEPWANHGWVRFTDDGRGQGGCEQGDTCYDDCWALRDALAYAVHEHAGKIALPDGSVIEVEATTWLRLAEDVALRNVGNTPPPDYVCVKVLAAWNAEHGIGIEVAR